MIREHSSERQIEEKIAAVEMWLEHLAETGEVLKVDSALLRDVLTHFGAEFKEEANEHLEKFKSTGQRAGLDMVWGVPRVAKYRTWMISFLEEFESKPGNRPVPRLVKKENPEDSSLKNSAGVMKFFGELTAFASGALPFDLYKEYTEARVKNGSLWQENRGSERVRVKVPTREEPIIMPGFPPGFVMSAFDWLKSTKNPDF